MLEEHHIAETLAAGLQRGEQYAWPYPLTLFQPFSSELYAQILSQLPDERYYEPLMHPDALRADGTSTRLVLSLGSESIQRLPAEQRDFWSTFNAIMRGRAVCEVFLSHMEIELTSRFGVPLREIPCYPTARLGRDADGYRIHPHPDNANRVYTAQVYLAEDSTQSEVGTSVYERLPNGRYRCVRRLPFLPNTGFCFGRSDTTYHGVEPVSLAKPRQNLHLSCFWVDPDF